MATLSASPSTALANSPTPAKSWNKSLKGREHPLPFIMKSKNWRFHDAHRLDWFPHKNCGLDCPKLWRGDCRPRQKRGDKRAAIYLQKARHPDFRGARIGQDLVNSFHAQRKTIH